MDLHRNNAISAYILTVILQKKYGQALLPHFYKSLKNNSV